MPTKTWTVERVTQLGRTIVDVIARNDLAQWACRCLADDVPSIGADCRLGCYLVGYSQPLACCLAYPKGNELAASYHYARIAQLVAAVGVPIELGNPQEQRMFDEMWGTLQTLDKAARRLRPEYFKLAETPTVDPTES